MKPLLIWVLLVGLVLSVSCSRTVYTNFAPQPESPHAHDTVDRSSPPYWRSFFVFGWAPGELVIDASAYCGGRDHVAKIETRRSFVQGLIAAFAGYYINIYSPYTGKVVCDYHDDRS